MGLGYQGAVWPAAATGQQTKSMPASNCMTGRYVFRDIEGFTLLLGELPLR